MALFYVYRLETNLFRCSRLAPCIGAAVHSTSLQENRNSEKFGGKPLLSHRRLHGHVTSNTTTNFGCLFSNREISAFSQVNCIGYLNFKSLSVSNPCCYSPKENEVEKRTEYHQNAVDGNKQDTDEIPSGQEEAKKSAFQRIKFAMSAFMKGCKLLFHDVRQALKIRRKLKKLGNDVSGLTRLELRHMRQTSKDVLKTLPVTFVAMLPIIGYAAPVLAFLFPRQLLSSHFWRPEQKEKFAMEDHQKRSQYYVPLLKEVGFSGLDLDNRELVSFCIMLIDGGHAINTDLKKLKTFFREEELSLVGMPRYHLVKLCKTWLAPAKWYMPKGLLRELLSYRVKRIMEDDDAIRREGVSSLNDTEVAQACHNRGLEEAPHTADSLRLWLIDWIDLTMRISQVRDVSYIAHCAIFKSVNFSSDIHNDDAEAKMENDTVRENNPERTVLHSE